MTGMITRGVHTYLPLLLYALQAGGSLVVTNDTDLSVEIAVEHFYCAVCCQLLQMKQQVHSTASVLGTDSSLESSTCLDLYCNLVLDGLGLF